ncbi:Inhibin beta A chain [Echinococcus granulosus]|uniref:Tgf beta family n=1 Tax=Echinococcus granulosus TaxID=6210 RepID=A0A068WSE5_ECHGR|nr:Inhibin beta A chain [Echinococcus granulosus]CDS21376.1 tgf beta family [Echinococcus granulosus]
MTITTPMKCGIVLVALALLMLGSCPLIHALFRQPAIMDGTLLEVPDQEEEERMWVDPTPKIEDNDGNDVDDVGTKRTLEEAEEREKEAKRKADEEEEEFERLIHIEKFKRTLLQRLHLTSPPDFSHHGGMANRTHGRRVLRSLPLALQGRLLNQMRAEDGMAEPPPDRTDERETLILLKHLHWRLPKVASATFGIEMADDIDPSRIQSAFLRFETKNPMLKGQHVEVWEIFMTPSEEEGKMTNAAVDQPSLEQYNNLTWMFERQPTKYTSLPAPTVIRRSLGSPMERRRTGSIRIRPGRLAETFVPSCPGLVQVTFEISGSFAQWMSHRRRMPLMRKLVRSLIVVCPDCSSHVDPVDVNKGILEIHHRNIVRRTRRSLDTNSSQHVPIGNPCSPKGHKFSCCTQPFSLNLEDVGWNNWILHPKTVEPNYCHGSCQADGIQKTPHSDLMHLYRSQNYDRLSEVQREAMLSCCHPVKMASTSVLYVDPDNELHMDTLHNIIVLECGCS